MDDAVNVQPTLVFILLATLFLAALAWALWKLNVAGSTRYAYPLRSSALFVGFQLFVLPVAILAETLGLELLYRAIYPALQVQSLVLTTLFNFVAHGRTTPASIYVWWLVGVPLHAVAGFLLGRMLQYRLYGLRQGFRLLGSLALFEIALTASMVIMTKSNLWLVVWDMPSGW